MNIRFHRGPGDSNGLAGERNYIEKHENRFADIEKGGNRPAGLSACPPHGQNSRPGFAVKLRVFPLCCILVSVPLVPRLAAQKPSGLFGSSPSVGTAVFLSKIPTNQTIRVEILQRTVELMSPPDSSMGNGNIAFRTAFKPVVDAGARLITLGYAVHYEIVLKDIQGIPLESFGYYSDGGVGVFEPVPGRWRTTNTPKGLASLLLDYDSTPVWSATMTYGDYLSSKAKVMALPDTGYMAFGEQCQTHAEAFTKIAGQKTSTMASGELQRPVGIQLGEALGAPADWAIGVGEQAAALDIALQQRTSQQNRTHEGDMSASETRISSEKDLESPPQTCEATAQGGTAKRTIDIPSFSDIFGGACGPCVAGDLMGTCTTVGCPNYGRPHREYKWQ